MRKITTLLACLLCISSLQAANKQSDLKKKLDNYIETAVMSKDVVGFNLAVVSADDVLYRGAFGVKNIYTQEPVTSTSLFHIASVTKTFVGAALMQLHEQGKLDLDAPVTTVVPYFKLVDGRYKDLTIRQFASHISGMPDFDSDPWHHKEYDDGALERFVRDFISHKFLTEAPSTKYQYCNTGYELLGDVIAKASGTTFEDYVHQHILKPLEMNSSTLLIRDADFSELNSLHHKKDGKNAVHDIYPYNRAHGPSSTMISNQDDMIKYLQMYLNKGQLNGQQLLSPTAVNAMFAPALGKFDNVGLSWHRKEQDGQLVIYHGGNDGFKAYAAMLPELNIGIVFLTNTAHSPYHELADNLVAIVKASL
ncbi:serine hydrolase domain-containing protein [Bowmanella pacifica]|uniref:Beta-lactamase-related domain-containing protein n=1 Tax=Bowmanella pacifica TaxID=502051 RepID=A0A917YV49_9ALTE|nr:serine hydrolase domain-containing protein [Bowmanella pacifica]GGO65302.1 hypothetical protein GCM10010982_06790 [Bowmanella pacifica]